jgi:DNA-binding NarL/FixJ family response regulator
MDPRRVLLVAEDDELLDEVSSLVAADARFIVGGRVHSALEAIDRAGELSPDLVLMDVSLPDVSGFQAVPWFKWQQPATLVVLVTPQDGRDTGLAAIRAGADGCVPRTELPVRLLPTLRELLWMEG